MNKWLQTMITGMPFPVDIRNCGLKHSHHNPAHREFSIC
jgi:hypothetical protein